MKETIIALESASSALAEWVARARREHTTFVVLDATVPVARLVPTPLPPCTGADLAHALGSIELSPVDAQSWAADIHKARTTLIAPEDKWR